jgi:hypothetical protein
MTAPNPHADLFEDWLRSNPVPSLQDLVTHWGGYHRIPQVAWDDFDRRNQEWEQARLRRLYGAGTWDVLQEVRYGKGHRRPRHEPEKGV